MLNKQLVQASKINQLKVQVLDITQYRDQGFFKMLQVSQTTLKLKTVEVHTCTPVICCNLIFRLCSCILAHGDGGQFMKGD